MKTAILISLLVCFLSLTKYSNSQTVISIRLGTETGQDCQLASFIPEQPQPYSTECVSASWTYGLEFNLWRPLFKFSLTEVPAGSQIISAKLTLYGNPYPVSVQHSGENQSYIRRVTSGWDPNTVTWLTQPDFSTVSQAKLQQSISPVQDYPDIDVTEMVRDMIINPDQNFGFIIMNKIEYPYKCLNFASGDCILSDKRPKLDITYSAVGIEPVTTLVPTEFNLYQNYPNPFNPVTNIKFDIPKLSFVKVKIFNQLGNVVSILINEKLNAGSYIIKWDAGNFSSGVYFVRMESENSVFTKKVTLIK